MSEVKRLEMDHKGLPFVDENGVYVLYQDYTKIKAERDALAAENVVLKVSRQGVVNAFDNAMNEFGMALGETAADYPAPETPATEAYLNSVRAEGAMACGIHLREWYDYQIEVRAEEFAAQLRAGEPS